MKFNWNISPQQAIKAQQELRAKVAIANFSSRVKTVAGVDVGFSQKDVAHAAVAVDVVLKCCKGCRLPEPTRLAHHLASNFHV